jgi:cobalt-zinc-cadmium efflux system protein
MSAVKGAVFPHNCLSTFSDVLWAAEPLTQAPVLSGFGYAVSDPIRARILLALAGAPAYPSELADSLAVSRQSMPNLLTCVRGCGRWKTPPGLDLGEVREHILAPPHVNDVHDLHASLVASGTPVLSAHVTVQDTCMKDGHAATILADLQRCVAERFEVSIEHSTFQVEPAAHRDQETMHH